MNKLGLQTNDLDLMSSMPIDKHIWIFLDSKSWVRPNISDDIRYAF